MLILNLECAGTHRVVPQLPSIDVAERAIWFVGKRPQMNRSEYTFDTYARRDT